MSPADEHSSSDEKQRSLGREVSVSGIGLFSGAKSTIRLIPAPANTGIVFRRVDIPGGIEIPARVEYVVETPRCTILGRDGITIQTVEHLLSALKAFEIDNLTVEIDGPEVPTCDGSAVPFVSLIKEAGVAYQKETKEIMRIREPIFWSKGDITLVALPSDEFRFSYTLNYPHSPLLKSQFFTIAVDEESYEEEIAPARTFSLYEEIVPLIEKGSIKGGTLENAVIIKDDRVINPEGLRFAEEMVRHKILDLIGDLSLVGCTFHAHVIAIRSGHFSNTSFARELVNHFLLETAV